MPIRGTDEYERATAQCRAAWDDGQCDRPARISSGFCTAHSKRNAPYKPIAVRYTGPCTASWEGGRCSLTVLARRLCAGHYSQDRRGVPFSALRTFDHEPAKSEHEAVLWALTIATEDGECLIWERGASHGYPVLRVINEDGRNVLGRIHRLVAKWMLNGGACLPTGAVVHHRCSNKRCIRAAHLQITTHADNTAEMLARTTLLCRIGELEAEVAQLRSIIDTELAPAPTISQP